MTGSVDVHRRIEGSLGAIQSLRSQRKAIESINESIVNAIKNGHKLLTAGNGGSAAQAMHLSEELIGRYRKDRAPYAAICLNADPTALTCIANDFGYDQVFARQCTALLSKGDVFIALSTSGGSPNILSALDAASRAGAMTIGLLGKGGGPAASACDRAIIVDSGDSAHIQEAHLVLIHLICEAVENADFDR